jgi:hypothetical protein
MTISGCSSSAELIPFQQEPIEVSGTPPIEKCTWPELAEDEDRGIVYMQSSDFHKQITCQETEQTNYEIAVNNAEMVDDSIAAFNALIEKSKVHQQNAENELERIDDARKQAIMESLAYKGLLAIVLIAIAL